MNTCAQFRARDVFKEERRVLYGCNPKRAEQIGSTLAQDTMGDGPALLPEGIYGGRNGGMIRYHMMTETEKETIADWNYSGEYAIYNMPAYGEQKEKGIAFGNPKCNRNYYSYYDDGTLIGFTNILEEPDQVFLGIGIAPDICGHGYGQKVVRIAQQISKELYGDKPMYLEVRTWNKRAIACYEKAGFIVDGPVIVQETMSGAGSFFQMRYEQEKQ